MAAKSKNDALYGSLSLLILKILALGEMHGYAIASRIQQMSEELLRVEIYRRGLHSDAFEKSNLRPRQPHSPAAAAQV